MVQLDVGDLPVELTSNPLAYVSLVGLDIVNNTVHKAIWESFTINRSDRPPLYLRLLPEGYEFPVAKQKRTSYDRYVPKGILKTNWMSKHLTEIPALAVQFVDLDWDSPSWVERRAECASKLEKLRASLQGRSTRVALVLVQKRASLPGTDDQLSTERAAFLCSSCDLSAKTLFVLPHSDHLFEYTLRLQNAFWELSQTYYHHESRRIRNHREHLNKTTHQLLFVRHQFKIAFLSEQKQESGTALKNYKQAYANLMEVRAADANMQEIKTIAGFINYKMCRLSFLSGAPLDAIAQFRKHIDIFKSKTGPQNLAFEHSAWMAKQFSHFGDLFEEAVQQGLNAIQTQHPGFYYQQAANHATMRKTLCYKICKLSSETPNLEVLNGADDLEFYGQRPWRPCSQSLDPPDPQLEHEGILALQHKELQDCDHSMTIIPLLSSAVAQFKKYKCPRMKRQLTVEMGKEYYCCKDYAKALTLFKHVLWDYRIEKWRPIVSSILWLALKCAYLSANVQEYIFCGLEAISYWILHSSEEKSAIQSSINNLIQGSTPGAIPGLTDQELKESEQLWAESLSSLALPAVFTMQMSSMVPFIDCRAGFACQDYVPDQRITVTTYIRMNCPLPVSFTKLSVFFSNPYYNSFCEVPSMNRENSQDASSCKISLVPRNTHTYSFSFIPEPEDTGGEIQISSIALQLGSENAMSVVLHWAGSGIDNRNLASPFVTKAASFSDEPCFHRIVLHPVTRILPKNARLQLNIRHEPPALINEFYTFSVDITNEESSEIENVFLSVGFKEGQTQSLFESTLLTDDWHSTEHTRPFLTNMPLKKLSPGEKVTKKVFLKASCVGDRKLIFEVKYNISVEVDDQQLQCTCRKMEDISVETEEPFKFFFNILNMKYHLQQNVRAEEPFLLKVNLTSRSSIPLYLKIGELNLADTIKSVDEEIESNLQDLSLMAEEVGSECFCLVTEEEYPPSLSLGTYKIRWRRNMSEENAPFVETVVSLPSVEVVQSPVFVELDHPAHGSVRTPMTVTYKLHNRLLTNLEFGLQVDGSDAFMFSGNKEMHFKVSPRSYCMLTYNLYPLTPGYVLLPRIHLVMNPRQAAAQNMDDLIQEMIPTHLFVLPKGKVYTEEIPSED